jgi:hypothetical protein
MRTIDAESADELDRVDQVDRRAGLSLIEQQHDHRIA